MRVEVITAPVEEPIKLAQARKFCRIDADITDEDSLISDVWIPAARQFVEAQTSRALAPQTLQAVFDRFPRRRILPLPRFPLIEVVSIKYDDATGTEQTLGASSYRVVNHSAPGAVYAPGGWPSASPQPGAVRVRYRAGSWFTHTGEYGEGEAPAQESELLREEARQAMLLLINHWYERREHVIIGASVADVPDTVARLIRKLKIHYRSGEV